MKKFNILLISGGFLLGVTSCQKKFIDLDPPAKFSDAVYFKQPSDFKAYTAGMYGQLPGWNFGNMDNNSDLSANSNANGADLGRGTIDVGNNVSKNSWNYSNIRSCNILLSKAAAYTGSGDII